VVREGQSLKRGGMGNESLKTGDARSRQDSRIIKLLYGIQHLVPSVLLFSEFGISFPRDAVSFLVLYPCDVGSNLARTSSGRVLFNQEFDCIL